MGRAESGAFSGVCWKHRWRWCSRAAFWCRPTFAYARRWRDANSLRSQGESILFLAPDTAVLIGIKIYKWCSTRLSLVSSCRTRRSLSRVVVTPHFWPTAEGQVLLQKWPEPMDARAQMPGERGSSTSRRRTDLRSVCGRLTIDRRRRKVRIPLLNRALHALAHTMFTY